LKTESRSTPLLSYNAECNGVIQITSYWFHPRFNAMSKDMLRDGGVLHFLKDTHASWQ